MPSDHDVVRCERCGARIRWTITAANRVPMAVNADPDPDGNQAVYQDDTGRYRSRALADGRTTLEGSEWQAMPHAATCTEPPPRRRQPQRPARSRQGVRPHRWQRP